MEIREVILSGPNRQSLLWRIVGAVRRMAQTIPAFRDSHNGCIRITIVPLMQEADDWLGGGMSDFTDADVCEQEYVYKIDTRGSHTIQCICEDGHTEPVNCYGYSALKTAFVSETRKQGQPIDESHMKYYTEDNGWSCHAGSVCTTVTLNGEDFIRLYVCTSGAKSDEDERCSLSGILEAQKYLEEWPAIRCNPYIDDKKTPLVQIWREAD